MAVNKGGRRKKEDSEDTRKALLIAAKTEFAKLGLGGARVDAIAKNAGVNKQLVYHYFGSKDDLYTSVLEEAYKDIRQAENELDLDMGHPEEAMRKLIEFSFDYLALNRAFVMLVSDENTHRGKHLEQSEGVAVMNQPIIDLIEKTLVAGAADGVFERDLDPYHVYLSIAGMSFFYFSNAHTLSRVFGRNLMEENRVRARRDNIVAFTLAAIAAK